MKGHIPMRMFVLSLLLTVSMAAPAFAADEPAAAAPPAAAAVESNPHIQAMNDKAKALAAVLTEEEATTLGTIRDNFGILRSVEIARTSVKEAVLLCAEKNPDMKDEITKRHKTWDSEIEAVSKKQDATLDKAVTKERFSDPAKVKDYLDTIDKAAHFSDESIEKQIITTPEACKNLMNSMDETQKVITGMISDMKWPEDKPAGKAATP